MSTKSTQGLRFLLLMFVASTAANGLLAQAKDKKKKPEIGQSIGGKEHESNIYGVQVGMDVSTALQNVFVNANRKPGQEKPDVKKSEGKDKRDIRVLYEHFPAGALQIVFADGKLVKEIVLTYANPLLLDELRLPFTGSLGNATSLITTQSSNPIGLSQRTETLDRTKEVDLYNASNAGNTDRRRGEALDGARFDDRYTIAFGDNQRLQRIWYRDEKVKSGYRVRVQFISERKTKAGSDFVARIGQKVLVLLPEDEQEFRKALNLPN